MLAFGFKKHKGLKRMNVQELIFSIGGKRRQQVKIFFLANSFPYASKKKPHFSFSAHLLGKGQWGDPGKKATAYAAGKNVFSNLVSQLL